MPEETQVSGPAPETVTAVETAPQQAATESQQAEQQVETPASGGEIVADALKAFESYKNGSNAQSAAKPIAQQSEQTQAAKPGFQKYVRDLTGLDEHEARMFKDMSVEAYKRTYPVYLESKKWKEKEEAYQRQLEEARQTTSYDQDGAWRLSPEYSNLSSSANRLNWEVSFCEKQLENLEAGEDIVWLKGYDDNGNPIYTEPFKPGPRDRTMILSTMSRANTMAIDANNKMQQFEGSFKQKHTGYVSGLQQVRSQLFKGVDLQRLETAAKSKLENFPSHVRSKPEVKLLAETMVIFDGLHAMIQNLQNQLNNRTIQAKTSANAGPNSGAIQGGDSGVETVGSVVEQFNRIKQRALR